jgi:hypothetical protein
MTRCARPLYYILLCCCVLFATSSFGQERYDNKHEKEDDPAAYARWFMKSRVPRNSQQTPAALLEKATEQKMQLRAAHLRQMEMARQAGKQLAGVGNASSVWTSVGPSPIIWNTPSTDPTQSFSGRITAVAVDQSDTSGKTVVVGGAYGGVWRTTNGTDPAANIKWTPLTDDQATLSIGSIAIQPGGNGSTIIVGTGEPNGAIDSYYGMGLLVTTDTGAHWNLVQQTSDATPMSFTGKAISAIAFNTTSGNTSNIVAAVASPGVALGNSDTVRGAVYSSDGGATWHAATISDGGTHITDSSVMSAVFDPVESKFFIVVRRHGVFVSADQGHTFTKLATQPNATILSEANCPAATNPNTCPLYRAAMAVRYVAPGAEKTSPDELYIWMIGFDTSGNTINLNLYQTKDGGTTWTALNENGINTATGGDASGVQQAWYDVYLGAVPTATGTDLFAGTINIYKCSISSSNPTCAATPFKNLTHVYDSTCTNFYPNVHPDQHGFDYVGSGKITYFGTDGGMYRSLDETTLTVGNCTALNVFDDMNADLGSLAQFVWGSQKYNKNSEFMGGTQDNGTSYVDNSFTVPGTKGWYEQNGGDGGYNAIDNNDNWYSTNTGVTIQACPGGWVGCTQWQNLIIDVQGGPSATDGDYPGTGFYTPFILDPQDQTKVIVGTCRIWRGANTAASWTSNTITNALSHKFNTTLDSSCTGSDNSVTSIAAGGPKTTAGSKVIYAGTSFGANFNGGIFVTNNAGAPGTAPTAWTNITGSIDTIGYAINGIAVDPHDATGGTAVAVIQGFTGGSGKVWRTTSFGSSWTDISGNLPDVPANDVLVDPDSGSVIYVATDIGVFVTSDEATWTEVGPSSAGSTGFLPNTTVVHIAMYESGSDKRLRAWTHGRGAWETVLASGSTQTATDFAFNVGTNPTTATVTAGSSASYSFNIDGLLSGTVNNATGFSPALTLACSGLPSKSSCSFTPASLTAPGTVALAIQTTATTTASATPLHLGGHFAPGMLAALALPGLGILVPFFSTSSRRQRLLMSCAFFVVLASLMLATACGGGSSTPPPTTIPGTPAGTYSVVVTGTYGSITHTQTLTLTVQ